MKYIYLIQPIATATFTMFTTIALAEEQNLNLSLETRSDTSSCIVNQIENIELIGGVASIGIRPIPQKDFGGHCGCISATVKYNVLGLPNSSDTSQQKEVIFSSDSVNFGDSTLLEFNFQDFADITILPNC